MLSEIVWTRVRDCAVLHHGRGHCCRSSGVCAATWKRYDRIVHEGQRSWGCVPRAETVGEESPVAVVVVEEEVEEAMANLAGPEVT